MGFRLMDTDIYPLPKNEHMLHLATIGSGASEFVVMLCIKGSKKGNCYIEEVVYTSQDYSQDITGNFKYIKDDNLAFDLAKFAEQHKLTDVSERLMELSDQGKASWLIESMPQKN